jgi:SAM-dependent methyltransferase
LRWNKFYKKNDVKFFKDRHWIQREFPELIQNLKDPFKLLEVGCGVGNTVFPLSKLLPNTFIYCFDFSKKAIELVKSNKEYNENKIKSFVLDLTKEDIPDEIIEDDSLDFVTLIFVLSAMSPELIQNSIHRIHKKMKKGGICFLRDYAIKDMTQIRFSKSNKIDENYYVR